MTNSQKQSIKEKFKEEFYVEGVHYKGNRHWKDDVKYNLIINWWLTLLEEELARQEEMCDECGNPFQPHHWMYGQRGKMYHTNCLLKDNTRPLAMVKNALARQREEMVDYLSFVDVFIAKEDSRRAKEKNSPFSKSEIAERLREFAKLQAPPQPSDNGEGGLEDN